MTMKNSRKEEAEEIEEVSEALEVGDEVVDLALTPTPRGVRT